MLLHIVCLCLDTIRCINLAAAAKKLVNPEICYNILLLVGFRVVDPKSPLADIKLEINVADNDECRDERPTWLTMDELKLCHGILDVNRRSIEEAFNVTNSTFLRCVSCFCGIFCNFNYMFFPISFV